MGHGHQEGRALEVGGHPGGRLLQPTFRLQSTNMPLFIYPHGNLFPRASSWPNAGLGTDFPIRMT